MPSRIYVLVGYFITTALLWPDKNCNSGSVEGIIENRWSSSGRHKFIRLNNCLDIFTVFNDIHGMHTVPLYERFRCLFSRAANEFAI